MGTLHSLDAKRKQKTEEKQALENEPVVILTTLPNNTDAREVEFNDPELQLSVRVLVSRSMSQHPSARGTTLKSDTEHTIDALEIQTQRQQQLVIFAVGCLIAREAGLDIDFPDRCLVILPSAPLYENTPEVQ